MCGIVGRIGQIGEIPKETFFDSALKSIYNRGPDDFGIQLEPSFQLAMRRLSILDAAGGHQPMSLPDGSTIVFNGQIYNHLSLRKLVQNYEWKTRSDTETLLVLLHQLGKSIIPQLLGMFAFAFWNQKEQELIMSRDRFGEKPFFYSQDKDTLLFASTCDALLKIMNSEDEINVNSLAKILVLGFLPPENSVYKKIQELPRATTLTFRNGTLAKESFEMDGSHLTNSNHGLVTRGLEIFKSVLEEELVADVPVGLFLSGGIDSSLIASLMKYKPDLISFTASMISNQYDVKRAKDFAQNNGIRNESVLIDTLSVERAFEDLALAFDQPFGDSAAIPMLLMSEHAKKYVGVCLSGDGADELFGGYGWRYTPLDIAQQLKKYSNVLRQTPDALLRYLSSTRKANVLSMFAPYFETFRNTRSYLHASKDVHREIYLSHNFLYGKIEDMSNDEKVMFNELIYSDFQNEFTFESAMNFDQDFYLPNDILVKTDRASMFHSLEVRSPYLHPKMYEFSLALEPKYKVNRFKTKEILYQMLLESSNVKFTRPRKVGLGGPVKEWIRIKKVQDTIEKSKSNPIVQETLNLVPRVIREQINAGNYQLKWNVAVIQEWLSRRFG